MEEFLSIKEFASLMRLCEGTIRNAIKSGRLKAVRIGFGKRASYRIPRSEINRIALFDLKDMVEQIVEHTIQEKK